MTVHDVVQGTPEWLALRAGRLTGTGAADMLATVRTAGKEAAARRDLRLRLAVERLTGLPIEDTFKSADMQRGTDLQPAATAAYEARSGRLVQEIGFLSHDTLRAGYSPDGFVGDDGLLELKVPKSATHLGYLRGGVVPVEHVPQIQHGLWISGRAYCDFVSYDDRFVGPLEPLQLFVVRFLRDEAAIASYELLVRQFLAEVQAEVEAVAALVRKVAA